MIKKLIILILCMLSYIFLNSSKDLTISRNPNALNQSETVVYIHNIDELQNIKNNNKGTYLLKNDIDCDGVNWQAFDFYGVLDCNNFTLSNLLVGRSFIYTNYGIIKNLKFQTSTSSDACLMICNKNEGELSNINFISYNKYIYLDN